jgi:aminocarboxymuconate-semialdehyde decarboxylase
MLIDMHAHVIPGEFPGAGSGRDTDGWPAMVPEPAGGARVLSVPAAKLRFTAASAFFDAEARLAAMDASGTDAEVVSPMPPLLDCRLAAKSARDLCRWINEFVVSLCAVDPSRFFGFGTVPLQDPGLAAAELSAIATAGLCGVEIGSNVSGASLGEDRFAGFFAEAERLGLPVFVHALSPTVAGRLPAAAYGTFGFATEIALTAASIITGGTADRCPDLRLAFSHGAGGFPLMLTRAQYFWGGTWNEEPATGRQRALRPQTQRPQHSPAEYARRFYYDTLVFDRRALRYLIDMIGPERLLVGTDFPAMPREDPAGRTLRSMGLPQSMLDDITWNNCFRFLGIEPPAPAAR